MTIPLSRTSAADVQQIAAVCRIDAPIDRVYQLPERGCAVGRVDATFLQKSLRETGQVMLGDDARVEHQGWDRELGGGNGAVIHRGGEAKVFMHYQYQSFGVERKG